MERGVPAGYQTVALAPRGKRPAGDLGARAASTAAVIRAALAAFSTLPTNTFMSVPVPIDVMGHPAVASAMRTLDDLRGIVLDITDFTADTAEDNAGALARFRQSGALVAVGGRDAPQPELRSIIGLRPSIIRLGGEWVRGVDGSADKRSAIEVTGRLAAQLDAWILAEAVSTAAELQALGSLHVPLAQGPFIGEPHQVWPSIKLTAQQALPRVSVTADGVLRSLVQQTHTTSNGAAAVAVLPEASGYDIVVVVDDNGHPTALLEKASVGGWGTSEVLAVNVNTPVADAVARAMARPRDLRFSPLVCTDEAGRFVGTIAIDHLMNHLAQDASLWGQAGTTPGH